GPTTGGTALATTQRVIDRVHGHATDLRPTTAPAIPAGFADHGELVIQIAHLAYRGHALLANAADLGRRKAEGHVVPLLGDDLDASPGGTSHLAALARSKLDVVHRGAERNQLERERVPDLHISARTRQD